VRSTRAVVRDLPIQEGSIRREIIDVLRHLAGNSISDKELTELLQSSLRSADWRTRRAAAEATGELGLNAATGTLVRFATDLRQHFMVRYAATEALGHLATDLAIDAVRQVLIHDPSLFARTAAAEAIGVMPGTDAGPDLRNAVERDQEWRVRRAAAESCGFIQDSDAIGSLTFAADDSHFRVRAAVAWALGEIGGEDAQRVLGVLATDRSSLVRRSADRSLTQLR
jgi:bilin biosynthesis protein